MSIHLGVFGQSGRMGKEVTRLASRIPEFQLVDLNDTEATVDLIIDFSLPEGLDQLLEVVQKHKAILVSGTTGFSEKHFESLKYQAQSTAVFWSANMSFGIYLMSEMARLLGRYNQFYKLSIEETHHVHKKDKPSGTAILIDQAVSAGHGQVERVESIREGEVFGIHRLIATNENESLEIRHEAFNRGLFAQGALDISLWAVKQKPGFYGMNDFFSQLESSP